MAFHFPYDIIDPTDLHRVEVDIRDNSVGQVLKKALCRKARIGLDSLSEVGDKLKILDKKLKRYGMRVGATQDADIEMCGGKAISVSLTVYFVK